MRSWNVTCYAPIGRIKTEGAEKQTNDTTREVAAATGQTVIILMIMANINPREMRGETLNCMAIIVL